MGLVILLVAVAVLGAGVYYAVFFSAAPEVARERLGELEALPPDLGEWQPAPDPSPTDPRLVREERMWLDTGGGFGSERLLKQVRYRSVDSGEIVSVEPDVVVRRRRVRAR